MENIRKNRLNRLRITSLALASMILMGSGAGHANAMIPEDGSSTKKEAQSSVTDNNDSEITPEEQQVLNESKITDEWDSFSLQDLINGSGDLEIYEFLLDGESTKAVVYTDSRDDEKNERTCAEIFSEEPIFIKKYGERILIGVGKFEGKKIEFVADYELSQYFEEVEKRSINIDEIETFGELREIIMETPSLIDYYIDMSKLQLKENNNERRLVYCPDAYMKLEEDSLKTYVKTKRS